MADDQGPTTRRERDALGELDVPAEALYGIQTERARRNFQISGLLPLPVFVEAMVRIKRAAARTHAASGRLDTAAADAIVAAADEVLAGRHREHFVVDPYQAGAGTSHNMNVNEVLANRANELLGQPRGTYAPVHPNDHVNMAQSTNDTIPTAIRVAALTEWTGLESALERLASALDERAAAFDDVVKAGRTHLQDATPIRLGQVFAAFAGTVRRNRARIAAGMEHLRDLNIGGSAVGTGINVQPGYAAAMAERLADDLGQPLRAGADPIQLMQSMGDLVGVSGALRTYAVDLGKIASDVRLLASGPRTGLAEIAVPAVQPGSSIMPGKVNPVIAEMVNMVCFQVIGNDVAVAAAGEAGQLELNVMMPVIAQNLLVSIQLLTNASLTFADRCVGGIEANHEQIRRWLEQSPAIVTALAPRIGYAAAAELAKEAVARGLTVRALVEEKGLLDAETAAAVFDLRRMTEPGIPGE